MTIIDDMKSRMADIEKQTSSSMCLAKWLQSTVTLYNGFTHSCHHPSPHKVPIAELSNSTALHNTKQKMAYRAQMLDGQRPPECQYCWNIEDLGQGFMSDRTYKSASDWAYPHLQKVLDTGLGETIAPTYLEVAFENTCNFKCAYCTPDVSSKWMEEIQQFGPYPTSSATGDLERLRLRGQMPIPHRENNPYLDAFWKWWPELYQNLSMFRITGGEPLLSKNLWRLLDEIKAHPRPDFNFAINTNMGVPDEFIDRLISYHNAIRPQIKSFDIFTSCEASGPQAEYIRFGMNYGKFMENVRRFLRETSDCKVNFMITFNALSITTFRDFLADIWKLRSEFNTDPGYNRIPIMISYLRWPTFMSMKILPEEIKQKYIKEIRDFVISHSPDEPVRFPELDQIDRLGEFMLKMDRFDLKDLDQNRRDFAAFFAEYDRRRGTDFCTTFPEFCELTTIRPHLNTV